MPITPGTRIGPYEVLDAIGAGGMGEVYRARDTRLDRTVAIKVMRALLAGTSESRERFEREARAISQLNHPNICTLHDVGHQDGVSYLVLEYLEGETLAARIARGPMPAADALPIAMAICEALDKAHRQGIVHRDLKPGNVMLLKSGPAKSSAQPPRGAGHVKLLDFGLAKVAGAGAAPAGPGASPADTALGLSMPVTQTTPLTLQGTILGTFQYMSPEMLEGAEADARADIWAFGCVLYEMLSGKKAFDGRTQASLISAIIATEPAPLAVMQPLTPPALDHVVQTCLAKDPDERYQSAHDLLLQLRWIAAAGSQAGVAAPVAARRRVRWQARVAAAVAATAILTAAGVWNFAAPSRVTPPVLRATIALPPGMEFNIYNSGNLAVSPDGARFVFGGFQTTPVLMLRNAGSDVSTSIAGVDGGVMPFFSPDGAWLGFFSRGRLRKVPIAGGAPVELAQMATPHGAAWLPDDTIVFAAEIAGGLSRVSADGGEATPFTTLEPGETTHRWPSALPDGSVVFAAGVGAAWSDSRLAVQPAGGGARKTLPIAGTAPVFVPTGHLLFVRSRTLFAVPFDPDRLEVTGVPQPMIDAVLMNEGDGRASFAVSATGTAAWVSSAFEYDARKLVWVDRAGTVTPLPMPERTYELPRISPDGRYASVTIREADPDVWVIDLARHSLTRLTTEGGEDESGVWTPDSTRVTFASTRDGQRETRWKPADGSGPEEVLFQSPRHQHLAGWSPDGRTLVVEEATANGWDVSTFTAGSKTLAPYLEDRFAKSAAQLSPDGRWLAYASNESGRAEVYVRGFAGQGGRVSISTEGGRDPRWARDGRTLYFRDRARMMAVPVQPGATFTAGTPRVLFEGAFVDVGWGQANYDLAPDGRFLMILGKSLGFPTSFDIAANWFDELRRVKAPSR